MGGARRRAAPWILVTSTRMTARGSEVGASHPSHALWFPLLLPQQRLVQGVPAWPVGGHEETLLAVARGRVGGAVEAEGDAAGLAVQQGARHVVPRHQRSEEHTSE